MSALRGRLVDTSLVRGGVPGIALEGDVLSVSVFPVAGGKILDLVHKPTGFNLLWRNPRVSLAPTYAGAAFDDVWCGGWDELFPTDPPCDFEGTSYHDHGDLWIGPWEWSVERDDGEEATLRLARWSVALPCLMEKWISIRREGSSLAFRSRLRNVGARPVAFLWNQHVAHAVEPGSRIHLPARRLGVEAPYFGRGGDGASDLAWPVHEDPSGTRHDLSRVPGPESALSEFFFARDLSAGRCAVTHPAAGVGLELQFDRDVFSTVWLFGVYGGWRGHHFLLTEPCTSPPGSLARAVEHGREAVLEAGETLETRVVATVIDANAPAEAPQDGSDSIANDGSRS